MYSEKVLRKSAFRLRRPPAGGRRGGGGVCLYLAVALRVGGIGPRLIRIS